MGLSSVLHGELVAHKNYILYQLKKVIKIFNFIALQEFTMWNRMLNPIVGQRDYS